MMYGQTVVPCNKGKYIKASPDVIVNVFVMNFDIFVMMINIGYVKLVMEH